MVKLPTQAARVFLLLATISYPAHTLAQTSSNRTQAKPQTGCVSGYPDATYRGDRPMTRYEFAAGLNACLEGVDRLLPRNKDNLATREDFDTLIQRQRELNQQLRELNQRVGKSEVGSRKSEVGSRKSEVMIFGIQLPQP